MTNRKGQPFFFDQNVFDEVGRMTSKNKGPPLEFTAPDLEKAKAEAYEQGRKAGFAEGQAGLTKQVLALVQNIRQNSSLLFAAEDERKALYEAEALNLTYSIVRKIFPLLSRHSGIEDVREKLREIVASGLKSNTLIIEVPAALAEETRTFMAQENMTPETGFQLNASPALRGTECRLSWADGGAIHDPKNIALKIFSILEETLAARGITVHDEGEMFLDSLPDDAPAPSGLPVSDQEKPETAKANDVSEKAAPKKRGGKKKNEDAGES
ncbi:MAG: hypothetical protein KA099_03685 [Alphaproteobacteria bacterium]|nr:hypothetical protein [Alphaproteobacteria bacterium]MBP7758438.1 hypothetical protein [Alphaproteobacteria bacterium]MBP7762719.1 hypothetical protein [Alphaproteobacteria bacterium]MBP7904407.1 hypothetical protein [Alphaproteobacteria bacterium]